MEKKITYIDEKLERNRKYSLTNGSLNFSLNVAGMNFTDKELDELKVKFTKAHAEMKKIEAGEIKNPDENRKVTHFTDGSLSSRRTLC